MSEMRAGENPVPGPLARAAASAGAAGASSGAAVPGSSTPGALAGAGVPGAGHEAHPPFLAHHFETPRQQFESGKTGMWLFLSTEILLFSGLFCAYAVYRANHPEIFIYAHQFLDKNLGGLNTLVLILSSLTAAWAVRASQMGNRRLTIGLILVTLFCALVFLGVKGVEYDHKWKHGLLWGRRYQPALVHEGPAAAAPTATGPTATGPAATGPAATGPTATEPAETGSAGAGHAPVTPGSPARAATSAPSASAATASGPSASGPLDLRSNISPAAEGPSGLARPARPGEHGTAEPGPGGHALPVPKNVQIFFGIYFVMTGLHGIHVIAGMIAWTWVLRRTIRGDFSAEYFTPVDLTALYWHLVDVIWIYLFPLLYLIH